MSHGSGCGCSRRSEHNFSSMEGRCAVSDLLEGIIEEVCSKENVPEKCSVYTSCRTGPYHALNDMIESDHTVTSFTVAQSRIEVIQLKCVDQKASGYCGHYAVFFARVLLEASLSQDKDDAKKFLALTSDRAAFWRRYWESVKLLLDHAASECWWPWTQAHVITGDMERSFLSYLLAHDPFFKRFGERHVLVLHFAYGLIQDSPDRVCAAQECLAQFRCSPDDRCAVFILGVVNHWVTLFIFKVSLNTALFYLDSNNEPVLMASDDHLHQLVASREDKHFKMKAKHYSKWERENILQGFVDQRNIVEIILGCLGGDKDLRSELLSSAWSKLIESYKECVSSPLGDGEDPDLYMAVLLQWLEGHYCPQTIRHTHLQLLHELHGLALAEEPILPQVQDWLAHCQHFLGASEHFTTTGIATLDKFILCLWDIAKTFKSIKF